ncbi:glycosyltransferase [Cupriavidus sp. AU9028]|uniref:glycosyltransferase n=1 Tax=Cupriavidus sp. AU9028 TaxID=2871157 RepID=UPI001C976B8B|nr:glycosyltransferase [Cupriavidus sp. AU9028]MBY4895633.1 glycosyltransferase [Cupriavidus sp. AU9028]
MPSPGLLIHQTHFLHGGIETSLISLLQSLSGGPFRLGLSLTYPTEELERHFRARLPADVTLHVLAPEPWLARCRQLKTQRRLGPLGKLYEEVLLPPVRKPLVARRFRQIASGYDVVVDYDMSLSRLTGRLAQPTMGYSHFSLGHFAAHNPRRLRKIQRQCEQHYDRLALLNDAMLQEARQLLPQVAHKFVRLYNAIDLAAIRERAAQPADVPAQPYIVSVGRLQETQKDFSTLLRAYARLVEQTACPERLVIVGDGPSRGALEALARSLGLADRVDFVGFQSNPHAWVRRARLMAYSSKMEGLPNVLLEALAAGQFVISTDCPVGPHEILDGGRAGLLVPVGDAAALAEAMHRGLTDAALRERTLARAAEHVEQMGFGPTAAAFTACVRDLLPAHRLQSAAGATA